MSADAAVELLKARSQLFAFNSNNAVLQFLLDVGSASLFILYFILSLTSSLSFNIHIHSVYVCTGWPVTHETRETLSTVLASCVLNGLKNLQYMNFVLH